MNLWVHIRTYLNMPCYIYQAVIMSLNWIRKCSTDITVKICSRYVLWCDGCMEKDVQISCALREKYDEGGRPVEDSVLVVQLGW